MRASQTFAINSFLTRKIVIKNKYDGRESILATVILQSKWPYFTVCWSLKLKQEKIAIW